MNEYHRTIVDFLRGHGARSVSLVTGGKHPHVDFRFRDKWFNLAVHRDGQGHTDAAIIKVKELRTLLGEADFPETAAARKLNDMTPTTNSDALEIVMGAAALYRTSRDGRRLRFYPPAEIAKHLLGGGIDIGRISHDTWRLRYDPARDKPLLRIDGRISQLDAGNADSLVRGYKDPFGVSPAEYHVIDGAVHVRLLTDQLKPVIARAVRRSKKVKSTVDVSVTLTPVGAEIPQSALLISDDEPSVSSEEKRAAEDFFRPTTANGTCWVEPIDPRAVLAAISRIEATTPYRLIRLKDDKGWAWQAPMIRLGDC